VEIHRTARRHRVADEDIEHAYEHALAWAALGDDPPRYLSSARTTPETSSSSSSWKQKVTSW
jgi:hypothetical protein